MLITRTPYDWSLIQSQKVILKILYRTVKNRQFTQLTSGHHTHYTHTHLKWSAKNYHFVLCVNIPIHVKTLVAGVYIYVCDPLSKNPPFLQILICHKIVLKHMGKTTGSN